MATALPAKPRCFPNVFVHAGLETGDEKFLQRCRRGATAQPMVAVAVRAQAAGLRQSVLVLLALGGAGLYGERRR